MNRKTIPELILIIAFIALLCLPGAGIIAFTLRDAAAGGTDRYGARPPAEVTPSPHERVQDILHYAHNLIMIRTIKGIKRTNVLLGKERWSYWAGGNSFDQFMSMDMLDRKELMRIARILEERQSFCRLHGMRYIIIIVPNKDVVYPEFLPVWMKKVKRQSHLDQIVEYLSEHSTVEVIDMRGPLREARALHRVFLRVDSHWNDFGGYAGYREIMRLLAESFPRLRPAELSDYSLVPKVTDGGDFAAMLGLKGLRVEEFTMLPRRPRRAREAAVTDPFYSAALPYKVKYPGALWMVETGDRSLPRGVMFRDSMSMALLPHLAEHFSYMFLFWVEYTIDPYDFNAEVITHERPDVVITEISERKLLEIKENPEEVRLAHRRR
ncbi:MAG: hypothetical protein JXA20_13020 [Spirochaetes bacterium]|nr:hypothetical protein [Spirochaetota bacterium]